MYVLRCVRVHLRGMWGARGSSPTATSDSLRHAPPVRGLEVPLVLDLRERLRHEVRAHDRLRAGTDARTRGTRASTRT